MKRPFALLLSFLLLGESLSAQEKEQSWLVRTAVNYFHSLTAPKKSLDSVYVFQPSLIWTITLDNEIIRTGADLHSDISISDYTGVNGTFSSGTLDTGMKNQPYWKLGLAAGYGSLSIGYGLNLAKKTDNQDRYFNFGFKAPTYGAEIRYHKLSQYPQGTLVLDGIEPMDLSSDYPGVTRSLTIDGYYCFNQHRFVFSATDDARILQRRSAGSWMVTANYQQGDFSLNQDDPLIRQTLKGLQSYSTQQFSVGGGYSYNWVLLHRDPSELKTAEGLRNLTLNATVTPMISFLNHIQIQQKTDIGLQKERINGQPAFSPTLRGAFCYTLDRWSLCAETTYTSFGFHGADKEFSEQNGHLRTKVKTRGTFYEWSFHVQLNFRF